MERLSIVALPVVRTDYTASMVWPEVCRSFSARVSLMP